VLPVPLHAACVRQVRGALGLLSCTLLGALTARADVPTPLNGVNFGGALALTSDYIYRGVSESDGHGAAQADVHLASAGGTFLGVWVSSRDADLQPGAAALLDIYLGQRFELSTDWSASLSGRSHYYLGASEYEPSADYQEISAQVTYLDRWSVSVTAIPNAVRYWVNTRLSRAPAYVADASGQWLLGTHFFLTGGGGYYYSTGTGPGIERATGYAYGNLGVAYEYRSWRLDVGYFLAQHAAARSFPYPIANSRVAATLAWRF
jgi:uncharacterized protein (TIGR02001 family)